MKKRLQAILFLFLGLCSSYVYAQDIRITGKVTGSDNQGLAAVSVTVSGTAGGTSTDADGNYSISASPTGVLVFSYVGFTSQNVNVTKDWKWVVKGKNVSV